MKEVGPSRKILHARGVGLERRKPVTGQRGRGALVATRKINLSMGEWLFRPFQGPPFFGTGYARTDDYLSNSMVHKKLPKNVIIDEILAKKTPI